MPSRTTPQDSESRARPSTPTAIAVGVLAGLLLALALALCTAPPASAAAPGLLWQVPEDGKAGGEAGRFSGPNAMVADPDSGHLYVADRGNARIVELTAWGEFVKAWGWGVVASGPGNEPPQSERQQLTVAATAGTYRLRYTNVYRKEIPTILELTVPIGYDWPATDPGTPGAVDSVQEALADLPSFKADPGSVNVTGGPGDGGGTGPYAIEFAGAYADKDITRLDAVQFETVLTGEASVTTLQEGGSFEVCVAADGDVCQAGQPGGTGPGEMPAPNNGLTLDQNGDVYVFEQLLGAPSVAEGPSLRVQRFSPDGEFLAMWGGEVNKTTGEDICTKAQVEGGDICGRGVPGTEDGRFERTSIVFGNRIATGPDGLLYVGDVERIQSFAPSGTFEGDLDVPGEAIQALSIGGDGSFYVSYQDVSQPLSSKEDVRKLLPAGEGVEEVASFDSVHPMVTALDGSGNLYIVDREGGGQGQLAKVIAYEANGAPLIEPTEHFAETSDGGSLGLYGLATSEACGLPGPDLFVSDAPTTSPTSPASVFAYGPAPQDVEACPPPERPPAIGRQFAKEVGTTGATVAATIDPRFWPDTRYYVEYGTGQCSEAGGCPNSQTIPPGLLLTDQVTQQQIATKAVSLGGLSPDTTYHYRFVAESTGGGPVFGLDPDGEGEGDASFEAGLEGTFKTRRPDSPVADSCPNAALRTGAGAQLPDCRAYEMVSPVDKENGDIAFQWKGGVPNTPLSLNQSSPDGALLTYSSYRAFGDAVSAPITSTYLARRSSGGWSSEGISPPRGRSTWELVSTLDTQFKAFAPGLCESWLVSDTRPPLTENAPEEFANLYHRDNCGSGSGSFKALIPVPPESIDPADFKPELQGTSEDGSRAIFRVRDKLTPDGVPCGTPGVFESCKPQLYEALPEGGIRAVCVLPGGETAPQGCSAGTASGGLQNERTHMVRNAISADGSRIFWSDQGDAKATISRIFVRIEGAVTLPVSEAGEALSGTPGGGAQYLTAADDGSAAIFSVGSLQGGGADLYEYRLPGEDTAKIAGDVFGFLGASEDAQRIFLVSGEALDGGAIGGKPNLYLYEAGEGLTFIGILSAADVDSTSSVAPFSAVNLLPNSHVAQVSADGLHAAFMSTASLTGYDNTEADSGEPAAEVFLYDAAAEALRCVSCNPTGALPTGRNMGRGESLPYWVAARIPYSQTQLYQAPEVLAADGERVYFESFGGLVSADTNGKQDVYQWEAEGTGGCTEALATYDPAAEGCVDLISTGKSAEDSFFIDASASGEDVFFATAASLVSQDPGLIDIYDARVGGGFPPPAPLPPFCEGDACQPALSPPQAALPSSSTFSGPGNQKPNARRSCRRGKRMVNAKEGRRRCVKRSGRTAEGKSPKHRHARQTSARGRTGP